MTSEHISTTTVSLSASSSGNAGRYVPPSKRGTVSAPICSTDSTCDSSDSDVSEDDTESRLLTEFEAHLANNTLSTASVDEDCVGGTYFVRTSFSTLGVAKPSNEEAGTNYNPKGYSAEQDCAKLGFTPGQGYLREAFAYQIGGDFAKVPETIVIDLPTHSTTQKHATTPASLQRFVSGASQSWDNGPARYETEDVHRIGVLDLRLLNCDRHGGNILVRGDAEGRQRLYPIDHGYTLPTCLADLDFEWQMWPQSKRPFSEEVKAYISAIDVETDAALAEEAGIESEAVDLFKAATVVLKVGVELGMTLYELAGFFRRERLNEESGLELLFASCRSALDDSPDAALIDYKLLASRTRDVYVPFKKSVPFLFWGYVYHGSLADFSTFGK